MSQLNLFGDDLPASFYDAEWHDMPEFIMNPETSILTIKVSFKNIDDVKKFQELIGQKIYPNRENYWFPKLNRSASSNYIYIDDEP